MSVSEFLRRHVEDTLVAYAKQPSRILEDARAEELWLSGGYARRQVFELVQNGADAIKEADGCGQIELLLTDDCLYCANQGAPVTEAGVRALLMAHLSEKRGDEIGRFGLGFKSVLGVCEHPEILSRSVCFRFNPCEHTELMRTLVGAGPSLPRLRTASLLDATREQSTDKHLRALMSWATTTVRLRLTPNARGRLVAELAGFPADFLAFVPHVETLVLRAPAHGINRTLRAESTGNLTRIIDSATESAWKVFTTSVHVHELPEAARQDMDTRLRERDALPLMWAAPAAGTPRQRGCFWAFFPTQTESTLQGILNAPWKTTPDRENLYDGDFNREMLQRAAEFVAHCVNDLNTTADPARFLDVLPARDDAGWADRVLGEALFASLSQLECMPTARGRCALPASLTLRPEVCRDVPLEAWFGAFGTHEPDFLVHSSVETADRAARAARLGCERLGVNQWMEGIVQAPTPQKSIAVIRLADSLLDSPKLRSGDAERIRRTAFVLTKDDRVVAPSKGTLVFAEGAEEHLEQHGTLVHPAVAANGDARRVLESRFGIAPVTIEAVFQVFLKNSDRANVDWSRFWELSRKLDVGTAVRVIRSTSFPVKARALSGAPRELHRVLLLGAIMKAPVAEGHQDVVIDPEFHQADLDLLKALGATDTPRDVIAWRGEAYSKYWSEYAVPTFIRAQSAARHLLQNCLGFTWEPSAAPLDPLLSLDGEPALRMTETLIGYAKANPTWTMKHSSPGYSRVKMDALLPWTLRRYGWVATSRGPRRAKQAVGPALRRWSAFFPVSERSDAEARLLGWTDTVEGLTPVLWDAALRDAEAFEGDVQNLTAFYALAARLGRPVPVTMRCRSGESWVNCAPGEITITCDRSEAELLQRCTSKCTLYSPSRDDTGTLVRKWNVREAPVNALGCVPVGESILVSDRFRNLCDINGLPPDLTLQPCESLWLETRSAEAGNSRTPIEAAFRDGCLYYTGSKTARWLLDQLVDRIGLSVPDGTRDRIAQGVDETALAERLECIRRHGGIDDKLIDAIGAKALRARIPERHLRRLEAQQGSPTDQVLARLAHAVHGIEVLKEYRDALALNGLQPPRQWAGGATTVEFVRRLGFPEEYAGFPWQGKPPWEDVLGPVNLPALHDFQRRMCGAVRCLLDEHPPGRGILCLPTGAGKTRVAVEAVIEWAKGRSDPVTILWIAQREELCEQAVQNWLQAWRAIGPEDQQLRVNRLWGATNEHAREPQEGASLVVATFQTLDSRLGRADLNWALSPSVVIIDEAHGSITPSYTRILNRLGLEQHATARPLIGLTATPFRGEHDERATLRLAFRYDQRLLDVTLPEGQDLCRQLQEMEVLAYADHAQLDGEDLVLDPGELLQLETFNQLPASAELRLGADESRNQRILQHIWGQPPDWPILLFSTSVEHAEDLAVRLSMEGVSACAISNNTSQGRRRHAIEEFKRGRVRVLTNYGVLTTGFDAPSIRAVYVTRPVYSPVLYQQMVGRGLRGPKNGGKSRCLVVNVADNIRQYGEQLAFRRFEYLWRRQ